LAKKRCPNCGKRVPDDEACCPRCGYAIPVYGDEPVGEMDIPYSEADDVVDDPELLAQVGECPRCGRQVRQGWDRCLWCGVSLGAEIWTAPEPEDVEDESDDSHKDGIFDLELLEQAEAYVKGLPDGLLPGGVRPRIRTVGRSVGGQGDDQRLPEDDGEGEVASGGDAGEAEEPEREAGECPTCGRQAQKGWTKCPWCGTALGAGSLG
jgi:hypothetical protein